MDSLEERVRRIVMAGIGAVADAAAKSKNAVSKLADEEKIRTLATKGEETLDSVKAFGSEAAERIRKSLSDAEIAHTVKAKADSIRSLARDVHNLSLEERKIFEDLLVGFDRGEELAEDGSLQSEEEFSFGKTAPSPSADLNGDHPPPFSPTAPDDDDNTNKIKTNDVNDHIPQSVPPDY